MNPVGWASSFKIFTAHKKGYDWNSLKRIMSKDVGLNWKTLSHFDIFAAVLAKWISVFHCVPALLKETLKKNSGYTNKSLKERSQFKSGVGLENVEGTKANPVVSTWKIRFPIIWWPLFLGYSGIPLNLGQAHIIVFVTSNSINRCSICPINWYTLVRVFCPYLVA